MPPHPSVALTPTLPPPGGTLLALVRLRPRQLSYSDACLVQLRLQHPPLGHCGWPTPALGSRYGGPPSSALMAQDLEQQSSGLEVKQLIFICSLHHSISLFKLQSSRKAPV